MAHLKYHSVRAEQFLQVAGVLNPARARAPSDADTPDFHIMTARLLVDCVANRGLSYKEGSQNEGTSKDINCCDINRPK